MIAPRTCGCGAAMEWRAPTPTPERQVWGIYLCAHCDRPCDGVAGPGRCTSCDRIRIKR